MKGDFTIYLCRICGKTLKWLDSNPEKPYLRCVCRADTGSSELMIQIWSSKDPVHREKHSYFWFIHQAITEQKLVAADFVFTQTQTAADLKLLYNAIGMTYVEEQLNNAITALQQLKGGESMTV